MKTINYFKLKSEEKIRISNQLGLNTKKNFIRLKDKHLQVLLNRQISIKKKKESSLKYLNFGIGIKTYKGFRNLQGYPARGQRTHTNGKTKKKFKFKN